MKHEMREGKHRMNEMNIKNRTLFIADNLDIMRGINSDCIDLIYLDPPFNSKRNYKAPIGSPAEGAEFKDIWTDADVKDGWYSEIAEQYPHIHQVIQAAEHTYDHSMMIYLMAMAIRLIEMHRILKPTGSIYLHCDPTASHYLKLVMDDVFGKENFRNEIVWKRDASGKGAKRISKQFPRVQDVLFFYSKTDTFIFDQVYIPLNDKQEKTYNYIETDTLRKYKAVQLGDYSEKSIKKMHEQGLIHISKTGKEYKKYYLDEAKSTVDTLWLDIQGFGVRTNSKERTGYPTQKPLALLERIISASSNEGDVVLDPFCGCATACVAAEKLQRQWIGIDISPSAEDITKLRLDEASEQGALFSDIQMSDVFVEHDAPIRTDDPEPIQIKLPNYAVHKNDLYGQQAGDCNGCGEHFRIRNLTVDHIVPRSQGGTDHPKNLQLLCQACNSTKGSGTQEQLMERLKAQGIRKD